MSPLEKGFIVAFLMLVFVTMIYLGHSLKNNHERLAGIRFGFAGASLIILVVMLGVGNCVFAWQLFIMCLLVFIGTFLNIKFLNQ